ncbi:unnamed protein product [Malus baccata var. baccata]
MPMSAHKMAEGGVEKGRKKEALRAIEWGRETKSWRGGKNGIAEGREGPTDPIEFNEGKSLSCVSKLVSMAPSTTTSPSDASQNISLAIRIKLESNNFRIWLNQAPETNRSLAMMHVLSALIIYIPPRSPHYYPEEIVHQILLRLPVKSLMRFSVVCKSWSFGTKSSAFIFNHLISCRRAIQLNNENPNEGGLLIVQSYDPTPYSLCWDNPTSYALSTYTELMNP